jgi:hypothetical protein
MVAAGRKKCYYYWGFFLPAQKKPSHSINNMHGGLLKLPQQYQPLYKSTMHVVYRVAGIVVVG